MVRNWSDHATRRLSFGKLHGLNDVFKHGPDDTSIGSRSRVLLAVLLKNTRRFMNCWHVLNHILIHSSALLPKRAPQRSILFRFIAGLIKYVGFQHVDFATVLLIVSQIADATTPFLINLAPMRQNSVLQCCPRRPRAASERDHCSSSS